jgi:hypothetical protein
MHCDSDMPLQYPIKQMVLLVHIYSLFYHLALGAYPAMHSVLMVVLVTVSAVSAQSC